MKYLNLKVAHRLLLGFGVLIALFAIAAALAHLRTESARSAVDKVDKYLRVLHALNTVGDGAHENMELIAGALASRDPQVVERVAAGLAANRQRNEEAIKEIDGLVAGDEGRKALADMKERRSAFIGARGEVVDLLRAGQRDKAQQLYEGKLTPIIENYKKALENVRSAELARANAGFAVVRTDTDRVVSTLAAGAALALILGAVLCYAITRSIVRPLRKAQSLSESIAQGKLDLEIDVSGQDEVAQLMKALKGMQSALLQNRLHDKGLIAALDRSQALIEFKLDGTILTANDNFCRTMGYSPDELRGKHHSIFVEPAIVNSPEYRAFWDKLGRGEFDAGQYMRLGKGGREVWLRASYNPVFDEAGRPFKVVKCASDVSDGVRISLAMKQTVEQTQQLVAAAVGGDLTGRLDLAGKNGELRKLAEGINALMDTTATGIDEIVRMLGALAGGDLTQRISREFQGSFGRMKDDANATAEKLTEALSRISQSAETINTAAAEIASGNADLSQRTEEQASSLEETASSMEQLTSTVKQNADNARQANQLAATASEVALKGGQVVSQVVTTMSSINDSSKKIVDIISVIDGIAFQTNILALNAAVEAARAGEQGRGFAVVASEVRNLAQRSAAAAKEIKALIGDSVEKVDAGSKLVEAAGKTMDDIVSSVRRVTDIMGEITSASREQSAGIEQVHQAITQMDQVTQQNAALVEEAAAASESMREQASSLREAVHSFRLADGAAPPAWDGVERRGPNRATNVSRIAPGKAPARMAARPAVARKAEAATGTDGPDDGWEQF